MRYSIGPDPDATSCVLIAGLLGHNGTICCSVPRCGDKRPLVVS